MAEDGIKSYGPKVTGGRELPDVVLELEPQSSPRAETVFNNLAISPAPMHFRF